MLITTDLVIEETLTLIRFRLGLGAANVWWQQIDGSARLRWERVESDRFEKARMRELKLTTVITTDRHFRQVGFDVLPAARTHRTRKPRRP